MATTATLDLSIWRNDDVYEYPLRVIGPDLTGVGMRAQIRLERDTPGNPAVALDLVTVANAEGIRLAGVDFVDGRFINDVRLRLNKATRIGLPYQGEIGDAATMQWVLAIGGRTRIVGRVFVLAHALDSNDAPAQRAVAFGAQEARMPSQGSTLTIAGDDVTTLVIDGADLIGSIVDQATADAATAAEAAAVTTAAVPPILRTTISSRTALLSREPVANDFLAGNFSGLTATARGSQIAGLNGIETWLSTRVANASAVRIALYSRPLSGAANDGAGLPGDTLHFAETRPLPADFARDGTANHIVLDFVNGVAVDPTRLYLLLVTMLAGDNPTTFAFLQGKGVTSGDPGFPQANGYFRDGSGPWSNFASGGTAAVRWLAADRRGLTVSDADILSLGKQARRITVGAPEGMVSATTGATAAGIWWNEWPLVQGGLVTRLYAQATRAGWITFHVGERGADGAITARRSAAVYATGAGAVSFDAGGDFDAFPAEAGWLIGIEQALNVVAFSGVGNCWLGSTYYRGITIAMGAEVSVSSLPVAPIDTKRRRSLLWRETIDSALPPRGFDVDPAIVYAVTGLSIGSSVPRGWATRVYTHRYVRTDTRVTRIWIDVTAAGTRLAVLTGAPANAQFLDARNSNSAVEIDGVANRLRIKARAGIGDGSDGDPGDTASVELGFAITSGRSYLLEWSLDGTVHSAVLTDLTTSARSPVLTSGDPSFAGVDTAEGFQNGALGFAFVAGTARIKAIEVLHDGPSPQAVVIGDSITKQVYMTRAQGWPGRLQAEDVTVLRSAQPGGTSLGALFAAWSEVVASRPRVVVIAVGVNDVLLNVPIADARWNIRSMIDLARRVGARIVLTRLHPVPGKDVAAFNVMIDALAAGQSDISVWRWDRALTVNGDGTTPNSALLTGDSLHPNVAGAGAQYLRLIGDTPAVLD
ncbi:hypothetical protein ASE70_15095 [Sphingomonas sp. Leaf22]|uniref:GDSL-type esterase/lipase family protein n=1 Tax=Sphingomonas sp. Leaf22 TaxID=1735687 RepID=UPI000715F3EC|nr:GDSL-type esterase/lipase family protein [Sphingomonas sp. Leaf22]KQM92238.1 hypothetical protein ASE70_15095 [Sphingomonas sp. Leaf22]